MVTPAQHEPLVILIGGPPRCGKTLLASALARKIGGRHVCFDGARHRFAELSGRVIRSMARLHACLGIVIRHCATSDVPLVIEGADLVYRGSNNADRALDILRLLGEEFGFIVVTMGCGDRCIEERSEAIRQYALRSKDWIYENADGRKAEISEMARNCALETIEDSGILKRASEENGIPHLSIRSRHFARDIDASLQEILASLSFRVGAKA